MIRSQVCPASEGRAHSLHTCKAEEMDTWRRGPVHQTVSDRSPVGDSSSSLVFTDLSLNAVVANLSDGDTLLVTDDYNYPEVHALGRTVAVEDQDFDRIQQVRADGGYERVVAIGGCTALDFGRACAVGRSIVAVPTILSNCCISSGRSVINRGGIYASEETIAPHMTLISLPTIEENHADRRKNWSASGLGDLFSAFGAAAEARWAADRSFRSVTPDVLLENAPIAMHALEWTLSAPYPFDRAGLKSLAKLLHDFSITGHKHVPVGSEHALYYAFRHQQDYPRTITTHGKLVSIGNLLTVRAWTEEIKDFSFYERLRSAYTRIGLPVTFADLEAIGVARGHIVAALQAFKGDGLYAKLFEGRDFSLVDRIFRD